MTLSYNGVALNTFDPTSGIGPWIEQNIPLTDCLPFAGRSWPGVRKEKWSFPGFKGLDRIRPGTLVWPSGADRFAVAWYICDSAMLAAIGDCGQKAALVLDDGTHTLSTQMWFLSAIPLMSCPDANGSWLITLTDDRYFWRESADTINLTPGSTTWANLYSDIGTALGVTINHDTINGAYLKPDLELAGNYDSLPQLLDAVAYNCGQRIARDLDGTVKAINAASAATLQATNLAAASERRAGNIIPAPAVPESVTTAFRVIGDNAVAPWVRQSFRYAVTVTAATVGATGVETVAGSHVIHDNAVAAIVGGSATNATELDALATQIAADWYGWQVGAVEATFNRMQSWVPGGFADCVEWTWTSDDVQTRIRRTSWNDLTEELLHASSVAWPSRLTIQNVAGTAIVQMDNTAAVPGSLQEGLDLYIDTSTGLTLAVDTIAGTATLGMGWSGASFTYNDDTITYNNSTTTYVNDIDIDIVKKETVYNLTINPPKNYYSGITFNTWLEFCGAQFWCCTTYTLPSTTNNDVTLPAVAKTVYDLSTSGTNSTITGIVPVGISQVPQTTYPAHTNSATTLTGGFPAPTTIGNYVIARAWGTFMDFMISPGIEDNLSNAFTEDAFVSDPTSKTWFGIWRGIGSGSTSITFTFTGAAGKIDLVAEEVSGIAAVSPVAQSLTATGVSTAPSPGSVTFGNPYQYIAMGFAAAEPSNPATITPPSGAATYYQEKNGAAFTVGSSDANASSATTTYTPVWGIDVSSRWVAAAVAYTLTPGPQFIVLRNADTTGRTISIHGNSGSAAPNQIALPPGWGKMDLQTFGANGGDAIGLWWDGCATSKWVTLFYTPSRTYTLKGKTTSLINPIVGSTPGTGFAEVYFLDAGALTDASFTVALSNNTYVPIPSGSWVDLIEDGEGGSPGGTDAEYFTTLWGPGWEHNDSGLFAEQICDFEDDATNGGVLWTVTDDSAGHRAKVSGNVGSTVWTTSNPLLTVEDTHGHVVTNVGTVVVKDGTNTMATVSSGGTGIADVEIDATGGGGTLTTTGTDSTGTSQTDTATSTITFNGGLTYNKGTGGSAHNDTVSLTTTSSDSFFPSNIGSNTFGVGSYTNLDTITLNTPGTWEIWGYLSGKLANGSGTVGTGDQVRGNLQDLTAGSGIGNASITVMAECQVANQEIWFSWSPIKSYTINSAPRTIALQALTNSMGGLGYVSAANLFALKTG